MTPDLARSVTLALPGALCLAPSVLNPDPWTLSPVLKGGG